MKPFTLLFALFAVCVRTNAQTADLPWSQKPDTVRKTLFIKPAAFILPAAMIAYGVVAIHNGTLQQANGEVKEGIWVNYPHRPFHLDNYLMFAPTFSVYALNAAGIHGRDNFRDRTMILLMANIFANGTVFSAKYWSHELRPSGSDYLSFPSGHTAEAFVGAEFMRMEYKDVSPWYGVAGYAMATMTGLLRMYNDAHWASDVIAGAGVGIASVRLAYWLYPKVQHLFSHKVMDPERATILMPSYQNGSLGIVFAKRF
jgi:membrane-associated phospholipid phosphatase